MFYHFSFTTSETMRGYYLQTWYVRAASRDPERLKTLQNYKISVESQNPVEWYPAKMKTLLIPAKNSWKAEIKPFPQYAIQHKN